MSNETVCVGFICPICRERVAVLRSTDPIPRSATVITSQCKCGYARLIAMHEVQALDVWREEKTNN